MSNQRSKEQLETIGPQFGLKVKGRGGGGIRHCIKVSVSGFTDFLWTEGRFAYKKKSAVFKSVWIGVDGA